MTSTQRTIAAVELPEAVVHADHDMRGIGLVGDRGSISHIIGEVYPSYIHHGSFAVETEHGTIYLDAEAEITIREEDGLDLDDRVPNSLLAVSDILTALLAERFDWYATDDERASALEDASGTTARALEDLIAAFPSEALRR